MASAIELETYENFEAKSEEYYCNAEENDQLYEAVEPVDGTEDTPAKVETNKNVGQSKKHVQTQAVKQIMSEHGVNARRTSVSLDTSVKLSRYNRWLRRLVAATCVQSVLTIGCWIAIGMLFMHSVSTTSLTSLHEKVKQLEETIRTLEKKNNGSSDLKSELTQIVTNLETLNATLEDQGQTIQEICWPRKNATHVSFSARLGHVKKYTRQETIVFKHTLNNDGDAYNANTGIFTAPVDGKYWFSASISVYEPAYASVYIMKNNDSTVRAYPDRRGYSGNNMETATVSTVMDLQSGDTVYCSWTSGTTSTSFSVNSLYSNSFSGALLAQY